MGGQGESVGRIALLVGRTDENIGLLWWEFRLLKICVFGLPD